LKKLSRPCIRCSTKLLQEEGQKRPEGFLAHGNNIGLAQELVSPLTGTSDV
jgi:hypothetical protein